MVSRDHNQEQEAKFAYYDEETAREARRLWNDAQEVEDRKNAEEHGVSYEEWGGAYKDYAYIEHVEILGEPIKSK